MRRTIRTVILAGLLTVAVAAPSTAQEATPEASGLAALCEANAPDEATLATCLEIVMTVLEPAFGVAGTVRTTPLADLLNGTDDILGMSAFDAGNWTAFYETGERPKVGSQGWRGVATATADELGALLLTVVPDPCYENIYLDVWSLYGALRLAGEGARSGDRLIRDALNGLLADLFDLSPECGPGWQS